MWKVVITEQEGSFSTVLLQGTKNITNGHISCNAQ